MLHTKAVSKLISNWLCTTILFENPIKIRVSIKNIVSYLRFVCLNWNSIVLIKFIVIQFFYKDKVFVFAKFYKFYFRLFCEISTIMRQPTLWDKYNNLKSLSLFFSSNQLFLRKYYFKYNIKLKFTCTTFLWLSIISKYL